MFYTKKLLIFIYILSVTLSFSLEKYVDLDLIKQSSEPRLLVDGFLFTLPEDTGYNIFLRTNADNWERNYYFSKSLYNVWYLFIPYPDINEKFQYKLNINGYWEADPMNDSSIYDKFHAKISVLTIPKKYTNYKENPVILSQDDKYKQVLFKYYNPDAKEVNFIYSNNNWSTFSNQMQKDKDGFWRINLTFTKGTVYYYFLVDWKKQIDISNPNKDYDKDYGEVSVYVF